MRDKKVFIVGPLPPPTGGMPTVAKMHVTSPLLQKQYEILVLNVNKKKMKASISIMIYQFIRFLWILITKRPDITHIHSSTGKAFYKHSLMVVICKLFGGKVIIHIHGGTFKEFYNAHKVKKLIKKLLEKCDLIITLGNTWLEFFDKVVGIDSKKLIVLNNSIYDFGDIDNVTEYNGFSYSGIFIGRVEVLKGIDILLKVCKELKKRELDIKFKIIGQGKIRKWKNYAFQMGVASNVEFLGEIFDDSSKIEYLKNSDFLILPSRYECFPMVTLEAMMVGLPIIASNVGSIPEIVKNDINGYTSNPEDIFAFVKNIERLYKNSQLKEEMFTNNVIKARKRYSYYQWQKQLMKIYASILEEESKRI